MANLSKVKSFTSSESLEELGDTINFWLIDKNIVIKNIEYDSHSKILELVSGPVYNVIIHYHEKKGKINSKYKLAIFNNYKSDEEFDYLVNNWISMNNIDVIDLKYGCVSLFNNRNRLDQEKSALILFK